MSYLELAKKAEERLKHKREDKPTLTAEKLLEEAGGVFHEQMFLELETLEVKEGEVLQAVKVYSSILDDDLWLIIDPSFEPNDGLACYCPDEIPRLKNRTSEELEAIHTTKLVFHGCHIIQGTLHGQGINLP